jgi:hypothetical protein
VRDDPQNLKLRYVLCRALLARVGLARQVEDLSQAELDLLAVRTLTVALKRDSENRFLAMRLDLMRDRAETSLYAARRETKQALAALAMAKARATWMRPRMADPAHLDTWQSVFSTTAYEVYIQAKDPRAALASVREGIDANDAYERVIGVSERSASVRYSGYASLLRLDANVVDADDWKRYFDQASEHVMKRLQSLDASADATARGRWVSYQSDLYTVRAQRCSRDGAHAEAQEWAGKALDVEIASLALTPADLDRVDRVVSVAWDRLSIQAAAKNWDGAIATIRAARVAIPTNSVGVRGTSYLATRWENFTAMLESWAKSLRSQAAGATTRPSASPLPPSSVISAIEREAAISRRLLPHVRSLSDAAAAAASLAPATSPGASAGAVTPVKVELELRALGIGKVPEQIVEGNAHVLALSDRIGWRSTPALPGSWRALSKEEFDAATTRFKATSFFPGGGADYAIKRIRALKLPFYDDGEVMEAEHLDASGNSFTASILVVNGTTYELGGTSPPIHAANAAGPIRIRDATSAATYLRFFGSYLAGELGAFRIVEMEDELPWSADAPPAQRQAVGRALRPLAVWADPARPGGWLASASVQYSNAIFHALYKLAPTGMVEMSADVDVARDLMLENPRYTARGRVTRRLRPLNLEALGEKPVADEADALLALADLPESTRPAHYALLKAEAEALKAGAAAATRPTTTTTTTKREK